MALEEREGMLHRAFPLGIDYFYAGGKAFELTKNEEKDGDIKGCEFLHYGS